MTSPDNSPAAEPAPLPRYADRVYRSGPGLAGGVLLLALIAWLGGDALIRGAGRTPWLALAGLLLVVPLVIAFTLRPAVYAGAERLRVRNPFRTITIPWSSVETVRAGYSSEVLAGGSTYQLWSIPVSLRARKKAARQAARAAQSAPHGRPASRAAVGAPYRAPSDQAVDELRELARQYAPGDSAQYAPGVRWAYEIIVTSAVGAVLLLMLVAVG
jgi:hypothetical protein